MSVLEEIFYGRLKPPCDNISSDSEMTEAHEKIYEISDCIKNKLPPDYVKKLEKLHSLHYDYATFSQRDGFTDGFSLAMLIMSEVLNAEKSLPNRKT